jgi:hypothetical protein
MKNNIIAQNKVNVVSFRRAGEYIEVFDLDEKENGPIRMSVDEFNDPQYLAHTVSEFYGFETYFTDRYRFR